MRPLSCGLRGARAAEHGREELKRVAVGMADRVTRDAEAQMRLVGVPGQMHGVADLAGSPGIRAEHVAEAITLRQLDRRSSVVGPGDPVSG